MQRTVHPYTLTTRGLTTRLYCITMLQLYFGVWYSSDHSKDLPLVSRGIGIHPGKLYLGYTKTDL